MYLCGVNSSCWLIFEPAQDHTAEQGVVTLEWGKSHGPSRDVGKQKGSQNCLSEKNATFAKNGFVGRLIIAWVTLTLMLLITAESIFVLDIAHNDSLHRSLLHPKRFSSEYDYLWYIQYLYLEYNPAQVESKDDYRKDAFFLCKLLHTKILVSLPGISITFQEIHFKKVWYEILLELLLSQKWKVMG